MFESEQPQWVEIQVVEDELAEGDEIFAVDVLIGNEMASSTYITIFRNSE